LRLLDLALSGSNRSAVRNDRSVPYLEPVRTDGRRGRIGALSNAERTVLVDLADIVDPETENPDRLRVRLTASIPAGDPSGIEIERVAVNGSCD